MLKLTRVTAILAIVALGAMACGDDEGGSGATVDAGPRADSGPDSDSGTTAEACGIQVLDSGNLLAASEVGLIVSFNRPDGSLIGTAFTDVDGIARRDDCVPDTMISTGGELSIFPGTGAPPTALFTIAGVQPGDTVVVGEEWPPAVPSSRFSITSPSNSTASNLAYTLYTSCTGDYAHTPGGTTEFDISSRACSPTFDTLAVVRNTDIVGPHNIVGYAEALDTTYVPGGTSTVTLGSWVTLASSPTMDFNASNAPAFATQLYTEVRQRRGSRYYNGPWLYFNDLSSAVQHLFPLFPIDFFDTQEVFIDLSFNDIAPAVYGGPLGGRSNSRAGLGGAPTATTTSIDLAATLLPRLAGVVVSSPGSVARPVISWFTDGTADADGAVFRIAWGNGWPDGDPMGPPGPSLRPRGVWLFVTPDAAAGTLTAPALPDGLAPLAPREDETPAQASEGAIFDFDWLDYGQVITNHLDLDSLEAAEPSAALRPTAGTDYLRRVSNWYGPRIGCSATAGKMGSFAAISFGLLLVGLSRRRRRR